MRIIILILLITLVACQNNSKRKTDEPKPYRFETTFRGKKLIVFEGSKRTYTLQYAGENYELPFHFVVDREDLGPDDISTQLKSEHDSLLLTAYFGKQAWTFHYYLGKVPFLDKVVAHISGLHPNCLGRYDFDCDCTDTLIVSTPLPLTNKAKEHIIQFLK